MNGLLQRTILLAFAVTTLARPAPRPRRLNRGPPARLTVGKPSVLNCTWVYVRQPLSHFEPGTAGGHFQQKLCIYDGYWNRTDPNAPVFLYVGNESPVGEYVNATGAMWETAPETGALLIFAEHRYFGDSVPQLEGTRNCLAYLTTEEALADYAALVQKLRQDRSFRWHAPKAPVIAFGGSYGGMLAAWFRMRYPSHVDGAIAASAPIWALPMTRPALDGAATRLTKAATPSGGASPRCVPNLKATWVLIAEAAKTAAGRSLLDQSLNLCKPIETKENASDLINYMQGVLFNIAESSYPFPSDYITYATFNRSTAPLPAWPMQRVCDPLAHDFGVELLGDVEKVRFQVRTGAVEVNVTWGNTESNNFSAEELHQSGAPALFAAAGRGMSVWFNLTGSEKCLAWQTESQWASPAAPGSLDMETSTLEDEIYSSNQSGVCTKKGINEGLAWSALCCNEGMNLANTFAQGLGRDLYWPPTMAENTTYEDALNGQLDYCANFPKMGYHGLPSTPDESGLWMDTLYGGLDISMHSNIFFTNGELDPWASGGVLPPAITESLPSMIIPKAGHHLDLFFSSPDDTKELKNVRAEQRASIKAWIAGVPVRRQLNVASAAARLAAEEPPSSHEPTVALASAAAAVALILLWTMRPRRRSTSSSATPLQVSLVP